MSIEIKKYRKKQEQPMFPWFPDFDMEGVSVSDADKENGSPKPGDMIAMNPSSPGDQWLVAEKFFKDNYVECVEPDLLDKAKELMEVSKQHKRQERIATLFEVVRDLNAVADDIEADA